MITSNMPHSIFLVLLTFSLGRFIFYRPTKILKDSAIYHFAIDGKINPFQYVVIYMSAPDIYVEENKLSTQT